MKALIVVATFLATDNASLSSLHRRAVFLPAAAGTLNRCAFDCVPSLA